MDIFGEKRYDNLDWLTKACEPVTWSVMDVIPNLPEKYTLSDEEILEGAKSGRIRMHSTFRKAMAKAGVDYQRHENILMEFYELTFSEGLIVDLEANKVYGSVELVRTKDHLTEKELNETLADVRCRISMSDAPPQIERAKEILDLIGTEIANSGKYKRSAYQLGGAIDRAFADIMANNRWKIRSVDLAKKIPEWIQEYVTNNNLAAMRNFCVLKAATHRDYPTYEIEEEKL